ncbi:hypothetical protein AGABI2DRAFT_181949 [Agaricus bisporus var. bisporus H97]|uniref:hypothetical protein n=1 Tax=Agaricus bisporus var. bisporus (strain H97 / ATCC MYA-4626 / FGSC 10389) TaxID=936046 RepID=UPI00029F6113|nr:hypothetical protein AGABI2DRAFT_181949 [Agaricus bisporus var. bisporus H97]EKV50966.1 hypothetical protein AGABI2DRAFT_181949 [Agaricus bisporus var. bisporus H97]
MRFSKPIYLISFLFGLADAQLGLSDGFTSFKTSTFSMQLVRDSQTLYSLMPSGSEFDFIPRDKMSQREANGRYHLGDITFRARQVGRSQWVSGDTSTTRRKLTPLSVSGNTLAAANLGPTLPSNSLLDITRRWVDHDGQVQLLFDVKNSQNFAVEIGSLGVPLEFNNIFTDRTGADTNEKCSVFDPYIGQDAGFVQVTPLLGTLPPLVVVPVGKSPLEGWRFLPESPSGAPFYQSQTFEGLYEWQFHTLAWAQNEWSRVTPWNAPTSFTLQPGQTRTYGIEFHLGNFLTTAQWFDDASDPFKRSPSVISYDREVDAVVKDDPRAWIPGLSDEAGAGSWLAATMKQYAQPSQAEVTKLEQFVNTVLWGSIQNSDGTVKKAVFFYEPTLLPNYPYPDDINWRNWWSWDQSASFAVDRGYDYIHVAAAYWAMYRVARNYPSLVHTHDWQWYISKAVLTVSAMSGRRVGFTNFGLMGETVLTLLLDDLKREGLTTNATSVEDAMRDRANDWANERFPYGSEMAWDSTGQEGVYAWTRYFNDTKTATNALNSIIAYQPLIPHWGYNGNARRYWDNIYGGKLMRYERQIHHYGSGLNSLPLISEFQSSPSDIFLLRLGFGGLTGPLSNIDQDGFASASFHSFPDTLKWDGYSGDYGPNFSGHAMGMGTFIINHPDFGWQAFGGNIVAKSPAIQVQVKDSIRRRVYLAPLGTLLTLDAGAFSTVAFNPSTKQVDVTITAAPDGASSAAAAPQGRLLVEQKARISGFNGLKPSGNVSVDAGAFVILFSSGRGQLTLVPA